MSYDLAVWEGGLVSTDEEALNYYLSRSDEDPDESEDVVSPRLQDYVEALLERYPEPAEGDFDEDSWVWSTSPLVDEVVGSFLYLPMGYLRSGEVVPFCARLAAVHNLTCFDPQSERLLVAERPVTAPFPVMLSSEVGIHLHNPNAKDVADRLLDLGGKNCWLILDRLDASNTFAQVYRWGKDRWDLEHRLGSAGEHYTVTLRSADEVLGALDSWLKGSDTWRQLPWERLALPPV